MESQDTRAIAAHAITPSITFAVCTNKLDRYVAMIEANATTLAANDEYICILDEDRPANAQTVGRLASCGVQLVQNPRNLGLSFSRNHVLGLCQTRYLVFLDDDVTISRRLVSAIRASIREGYDIVGSRLEPPSAASLRRWFLSPLQYHYLGIHRADRPASVWGACMGFDVQLARRSRTRFQSSLGRLGKQLQSGDDTTFLRRLRELGARQKVIQTVAAIHHVAPDRIRFAYLLRRAIWQGRSEVRRGSPWSGLRKEVCRNSDGLAGSPRKAILGMIYTAAVFLGIVSELLSGWSARVRISNEHFSSGE